MNEQLQSAQPVQLAPDTVIGTANQTDADGTWAVRTFASGVRERQLKQPSTAWLAAQAAARIA